MSDDVERTRVALLEAWRQVNYEGHRIDVDSGLAPRVLAAIRAAVAETDAGWDEEDWWPNILDAALAALTDHPGGTDNE